MTTVHIITRQNNVTSPSYRLLTITAGFLIVHSTYHQNDLRKATWMKHLPNIKIKS